MSGEGHGDIPDSEDVMLYLNVPDLDASGGGGGQTSADPPQLHRSGPTPAMKDAAGRSRFPTTAEKAKSTIIMAGGDGNYKNSVKARSPEGHELHVLSERDRRKKMGCKFLGLQELLPRLTEKASKAQILDEAISYIKILEGNLEELEKKKMERIRASASKQLAKAAAAAPAPPPGESSTSAAVDCTGDLQVVQESYSLPGAAPPTTPTAAASAAPYLCPFPPGFRTWSSPNVTVCLAGSYATINICTAPKRGLLNGITQVLHGLNLEVVHAVVSSEGNRRFLAIHAHLPNGVPDQPLLDASAIEERFKRAAEEINVLCISV